MDQCKAITKEFLKRPCALLFSVPIDPIAEGLENYDEIVSKRMDLGTINNKLQKRLYNNTIEWYNDMCLVFQNAIDYYPFESKLSMMARYLLEEFKKSAYGLNFSSEQVWLDSVQTLSSKLTNIISQPPSFQSNNPNISSLFQRAEKTQEPDKQAIASYVDKLNTITANDNIREEVIGILKEVEGMCLAEITSHPVDLDKLKPNSLKTLVVYANEHQ
ncbi:hypothetical protein M9Y10_020298 [Tritrichomonas musculus]|uniref:Bromo domain-containing protein n=1 Tax=Tritrichomonas musculus TaxID=1915356 RepID=A0ABR2HFS1_9EUKA